MYVCAKVCIRMFMHVCMRVYLNACVCRQKVLYVSTESVDISFRGYNSLMRSIAHIQVFNKYIHFTFKVVIRVLDKFAYGIEHLKIVSEIGVCVCL